VRAVVVALGKIGLPVAAKIALKGHDVVGSDIDPRVRELVAAGREPFPGEAHLADALAEIVPAGRLRVTGDTAAAVAEGPDLVIAVPPVLVDEQARPDFAVLDAVLADIGRGLQPGTVVSVETTLPVGTTRGRVAPALAEASGLASEQDFFTIHSPERVYSGRVFRDLETYPKLVGGLTEEGERRGVELYRTFLDAEVRSMGSAEAAELTKLAETTYRDVNIALANEFAKFADRHAIDVNLVIDAANSQPFSHIHRPGIGVGGHCIPVYPRFYLATDPGAQIPPASRAVNDSMPAYAVELLAEDLGGELSGRSVLILGVSYRGGVKETAFSSAFAVHRELASRGARPLAADPFYDASELEALGFVPWQGEELDAAIVQADHPQYAKLGPDELPHVRAVIDGRGILNRERFSAAGVSVRGIGSAG
jgi:nucleotide sugar dehydrogenase